MKNQLKLTVLFGMIASGLWGQGLSPALSDATENGDGSYTNWFGTYTPEEGALDNDGWIEHAEHGRLYIDARGQNLWIYDPNVAALGDPFSGWIYTNRNYFPYFLVRNNPATFLLFVSGVEGPAGTPRVFIDTKTFDKVFLPKIAPQTIVDIAVGNPAFSSLVTALSTAGLVEALSGEGPFTVFAPTDTAFGKLDPATLNDLLTNEASLGALTGILTYHVVPGRITSSMLGLDVASLLSGESISGYVSTLNGADIRLDLTPFGLMINGTSMVTAADIEGTNGIIHVIDTVLLPPKDIVDTAIDAGLSTLVAAVQAAGLEDALRGDGPFTVFAPTDAAFAALGQANIDALLADPATLGNILQYHVVAGKVYSSEVAAGSVTMLNGETADLAFTESGDLTIDGATVIATDIVTSNGVIHVIDAVIQP